MEDAEDYAVFATVVTVDYDAQSAIERELVLRLTVKRRATRSINYLEAD
jgi:hypothetical protein